MLRLECDKTKGGVPPTFFHCLQRMEPRCFFFYAFLEMLRLYVKAVKVSASCITPCSYYNNQNAHNGEEITRTEDKAQKYLL